MFRIHILLSQSFFVLLVSIPGVPPSAQDSPPTSDDINVRYYQKNLELAQHDYQTALKANRQIPNINSKLTMLRLENQVVYATRLLEQATATTEHEMHMTHLQSVQNDLRLAEQQLKLAQEINQKNSEYVHDDELKRLQLTVDLARMALQRAKQPKITADPLHHLQWQIDRLRTELLNLQFEFERTRSYQ